MENIIKLLTFCALVPLVFAAVVVPPQCELLLLDAIGLLLPITVAVDARRLLLFRLLRLLCELVAILVLVVMWSGEAGGVGWLMEGWVVVLELELVGGSEGPVLLRRRAKALLRPSVLFLSGPLPNKMHPQNTLNAFA